MLNIIVNTLATLGLEINSQKSYFLTGIKHRKMKKMLYDETAVVTVHNKPLNVLQVADSFIYVAATFGTSGLLKIDASSLQTKL